MSNVYEFNAKFELVTYGIRSYEILDDLPSINGVTVEGDKSGADYNLVNSDVLSAAVSQINTRFDNTVAQINQEFSAAVEDVNDSFDDAVARINSSFSSAVTSIHDDFNNTASQIGYHFDLSVETIRDEFQNAVSDIQNDFDESIADVEQIRTDAQAAAAAAAASAQQAAAELADLEADIADVKEDLTNKASIITDTASGAVASFSDGAYGMPMNSVVCHIEPTQEGSGDPSPTNVRAISGYTGVTLSQSGANTSEATTKSISWQTEAGTVYGGTLDVVSGVLTVDRAIKLFDGTEAWRKHNTLADAFYINNIFDNATVGEAICNLFKYSSSALSSLSSGQFTIDTNYTRIALRTDLTSDLTEFKAFLAENPMVVVYPIATPNTYQLTPTEVDSLLGTNNIWHNCNGNTDATYKADTKLYIDKKIAELAN